MYKLFKSGLIKPLSTLINCSLESGVFPDQLKIGKIITIYKGKKNKSSLHNYRPISILPVFSKKIEEVFYSRLYNFLDTVGNPAWF